MRSSRLLIIAICLLWTTSADAASCFWVGGTGSITPTNTASWASTSGGTAGSCAATGGIPEQAGDTATFDGASGGGVITINMGGTWTLGTIICGSFTGTIDNSINNNNVTLTAGGIAFNCGGSGVRSLKLGSATYTLTGINANWTINIATNLTFDAGTSNILFASGNCGSRQFSGGSITYATLTLGSCTGTSQYVINSGNNTFANLNINGSNYVLFPNGSTQTITTSLTWLGTSNSPIGIVSASLDSFATIAAPSTVTMQYVAFRDMSFTGSPTAQNSFDLLHNSGITILGPSGGGGGHIIGG